MLTLLLVFLSLLLPLMVVTVTVAYTGGVYTFSDGGDADVTLGNRRLRDLGDLIYTHWLKFCT